MAMNGDYLDAIATHAKSLITHIGLVDGNGDEVGDGRKAVTWTGPNGGDGLIRPNADLEFDMSPGDEVVGWVGYDGDGSGANEYGGADFDEPIEFANPGTFTLEAASTGIDHDAS